MTPEILFFVILTSVLAVPMKDGRRNFRSRFQRASDNVWDQESSIYYPPPVYSRRSSIIRQPAVVQSEVPKVTSPLVFTSTTNNPSKNLEENFLQSKCLKVRGQFPSSSCNSYVNCWDGNIVEQTCPEGLLFSSKGYCDYPENVDCERRPIQGTPPSSTSTQSSSPQLPTSSPTLTITLPPVDDHLKAKCLRPRGQFPSDSCSKYVNCWDGVIVEQECPAGLYFSASGYCDYPHKVNCQNGSPSRIADECLLDFGTFRDRTNCSRYYTCIGGKIVAKYECPTGFSFNDNIGVCDYSERVDCSKEPLVFSSKLNKEIVKGIFNCNPGEVLRLNAQCTMVSLCKDNMAEIVQCPQGLAYDARSDKCILPHLAQC